MTMTGKILWKHGSAHPQWTTVMSTTDQQQVPGRCFVMSIIGKRASSDQDRQQNVQAFDKNSVQARAWGSMILHSKILQQKYQH